jgi:uncharacterized protein with HEPN domain/predicted nucleotidyltransferase
MPMPSGAIGATSLYLFGSTARDEAGAESDLDLFIDYDKDGDFSAIELVRLKNYISDALNVEADVTTRDGLHPLIRDEVVAKAERAVRLRLHDILEAVEGIESTVLGMTFAEYQQSWQVRRAVERGVEIISEASRHVPDELKQRYPHIYWREIAGIGNLLRHEYGRIDDRIMWRVVQNIFRSCRSRSWRSASCRDRRSLGADFPMRDRA